MKKKIIAPLVMLVMTFASCSVKNESFMLIVGKYNETEEKGFSLFSFNSEEGTLQHISEAEAGPNPSYFCISKKHNLIYAANEVMNFNGGTGGGVTCLKLDSGKVEKLSEMAVPNGSPCFISLSPEQNYLFLANYTGGSIAVIKLDEAGMPVNITDSISFPSIAEYSHAHMISFDPAWKHVYLTDLGLDRIVIYNFDPISGRLTQLENGIVPLPEGSGPRHFEFNANGSKMYVICELNSTISVFDVDSAGLLSSVQNISTLDEGFAGKSFCADIHIGKSGEYLYGTNRGENTVVCFKIGSDGLLSLAGRISCGGDWPRNFSFDPSGKFLLTGNQRSGDIVIFSIDEKTGMPLETGKTYKVSSPSCLKFVF